MAHRLFVAPATKFAALTIVCVAVGYMFSSLRYSNHVDLVADPSALDFGRVWACEDFLWSIPLRNVSSSTVHVYDMISSCGCTSVHPSAFTLGPGESIDLTLTLDLTVGGDAKSVREFDVQLATVGDTRRPIVLGLRGTVTVPFKATPSALAFVGSDVIVRGRPTSSKAVTLDSHDPTLTLHARCDAQIGELSLLRKTASGSWMLRFKPSNDLTPGMLDHRIDITVLDARSKFLTKLHIPVLCEVESDIQVTPNPVLLILRSSVSEATEVLTVRSRSDTPFQLKWKLPDANGIRLSSDNNLKTSSEHQLRIAVTAEAAGSRGCEIILTTIRESLIEEFPVSVCYIVHD